MIFNWPGRRRRDNKHRPKQWTVVLAALSPNFSGPIVLPGLDAATGTFTDIGAASNPGNRFYRIVRP